MRVNQRDKRPVAYAFYQGITELTNTANEYLGEYEISYSAPIKAKMNVSGGRGAADVAMFGMNASYSRSIVTDDLTTPFSIETVFWIDNDPDKGEPFDYRVVGVSRTINQVVLALTEVSRENN